MGIRYVGRDAWLGFVGRGLGEEELEGSERGERGSETWDIVWYLT